MFAMALTIDDAPCVFPPGHPSFDPRRTDRIREALERAGVRDCVAFVIGDHAKGHEGPLRRWLDAGFELGNHTQGHLAASRIGPDAYLEGVRRCDALLQGLGAFDAGRARYFRHPFGDRGSPGAARKTIAAAIAELGYVHADVTLNLHDYCYEDAWSEAERAAAAPRLARIGARYHATALGAVRRVGRRGRARWGRDFVHVAACHFGPVTEHTLTSLLAALRGRARLVSLEAATSCPRYRALSDDLDRSGIAGDLLARGLRDRALRRAARLSRRLGLFGQATLGPRWPHLAP